MHQGAENSALKNSAPSSFTARRTSDSTSIVFPTRRIVRFAKDIERTIKSQASEIRSVEVGENQTRLRIKERKLKMLSTTSENQATDTFGELKGRLKATWMTGDYDVFSRYMEEDAKKF